MSFHEIRARGSKKNYWFFVFFHFLLGYFHHTLLLDNSTLQFMPFVATGKIGEEWAENHFFFLLLHLLMRKRS